MSLHVQANESAIAEVDETPETVNGGRDRSPTPAKSPTPTHRKLCRLSGVSDPRRLSSGDNHTGGEITFQRCSCS